MSTFISALNIIEDNSNISKKKIQEIVEKVKDRVSEGRYLISVFDSANDWKSRIPIESIIVESILGGIHERNNEWEFYGNGAIRCYESETMKLVKTLQWNIVRRKGDRAYKRRLQFKKNELKLNQLPVLHKVFTRDVANNVWHLPHAVYVPRLIERFSNLLSWHDEDFEVYTNGVRIDISDRKSLDLSQDLVGVPTKIPYDWDSGERLF